MQVLWNISWRRSQCCTRAIANICEAGICLDHIYLYYHSVSNPRGVLSFAYNIYHVVGRSQCVVFLHKTSDCVVTIDVFFLKSLSPFCRGAISVSEWLVISIAPLSIVERHPFPKQPDTIHSWGLDYIKN
jgi:hypothetical protein